MINESTALQHISGSKCEVCDSVITYPDYLLMKDLDYVVCKSFDCRRIMSQKSSMSPHMFKNNLEFNKKLQQKRKKRDADRKKHIEAVSKKERQEHLEIFKTALLQYPEVTSSNTHMMVIPSGKARVVDCAMDRKSQYIDHLNGIVSEADIYTSASEVIYDEHHDAYGKRLAVDLRLNANPVLRTISDKLCTICKGGCCASGENHAYLSVVTIRRYMDNNPELTSADILSLYLSRISLESIEGSCINHTVNGCMLPRHLRSDICNGFYCDPLKKYQKKIAAGESLGNVVAIQRSSTYWNRFEVGVANDVVGVYVLKE